MNDEMRRLEGWYNIEMSHCMSHRQEMSIKEEYLVRRQNIEMRSTRAICGVADYLDPARVQDMLLPEETLKKIHSAKKEEYVSPRAKRLKKIAQQITIET